MLPNTIEDEPFNASLVQACIVEGGLVNLKDVNLSLSDKLSLRTGDLFTHDVVRQALISAGKQGDTHPNVRLCGDRSLLQNTVLESHAIEQLKRTCTKPVCMA